MEFPLTITLYANGTYTVDAAAPPPSGAEPITVTADDQRKVTEVSAEGIDVAQEIHANWYNGLRTSAAKIALGQWSAAAPVAPVIAFEVSLVRQGTIPDGSHVWLELQDAGGSVLAASPMIDPNAISATASLWTRFDLITPVQPAGGYRLVVRGDYPISDVNFVLFGGTVNDVFAGGSAQEWDGATWGPATTYGGTYTVQDHGFRVLVAASLGWTEPDPPLTYALTSGALAPGDALTGALSRAPGDLPGTYAITQGTLAAPTGYAMTFVPGLLTVATRPAPTQTGHRVVLAGQSNAVNALPTLDDWLTIVGTSSHNSTPIAGWAVGEPYWTELAAALATEPAPQGLAWWQSESNAGASLVPLYADALRDLLVRVRAIRPGLPVAIVSIGPPSASFEEPSRTQIFEIQRTIGAEPGNLFIDVTSVGHDGHHCTAIGYERAAYFIARALGVTL